MKRLFPILLILALLCGCAAQENNEMTQPAATTPAATEPLQAYTPEEIPYTSACETETGITLSDSGITVNGGEETEAVYTSHDIIYYEDKDAYESGYIYGEGAANERHSAQEAVEHTVVNITEPGVYRISGKLSKGQIRIDLGESAYEDENARVELILENADITCTVAPAILFLNVYECDGNWSADTAKAEVDTAAAGANLILQGENKVTGSHVAKIFRDKEGEKKLWKQDGAIYSYMSMNVYGPGSLDLTADNEGLDTELHLTVNGGNIAIRSQNDGINTNEDGVSVTTVNGGSLHIIAGLGQEGDGIDSNGYLVINGGTVVASANPGADAGMDSDMGSYINGGMVIATGSTMDWAETDSRQVTMNLQFAANQDSGAAITVTRQDGTVVFAYDPSEDEVLAENRRVFQGAILSSPNFCVGESYYVYLDGRITGEETGGMYDVTTVSDFAGGTQMQYTGTDVTRRPGGFGGQRPEGMGEFDPNSEGKGGFGGQRPGGMENFDPNSEGKGGFDGQKPEGMKDFDPSQIPEGEMPSMPSRPQGFDRPDSQQGGENVESKTLFYMQDKVNFFSGLAPAE